MSESRYCTCSANGIENPASHLSDCRMSKPAAPTQASAARLTAIANSPSPLYVHGDDLREDARAVLAQIDTLRQELREQSDRCDRADEAYAKAQQEQARLEDLAAYRDRQCNQLAIEKQTLRQDRETIGFITRENSQLQLRVQQLYEENQQAREALRAARSRLTHWPAECDHCGIDELPPTDCPQLKLLSRIDAALKAVR